MNLSESEIPLRVMAPAVNCAVSYPSQSLSTGLAVFRTRKTSPRLKYVTAGGLQRLRWLDKQRMSYLALVLLLSISLFLY